MSELFTLAPYTCGEYDPTTKYHIPLPIPEEEVQLLCTLRNLFGFAGTLIALLGIVGNILCLLVLPRTGGAKSAIILLISLGIYDTAFLVTSVFLRYVPSITVMGHMTVVVSNALSPLLYPLSHISHIAASYTTVAISVERCIAITSPFRVLQWVTTTRIKVVTVIVLLWSILFNLPRYILLSPMRYTEPSLNTSWVRLEPTWLASDHTFLLFFFGYFNTIFKVALPVLVVSVSNTVLVCCLRRRRSAFAEHVQINSGPGQSAQTGSDQRVTTMVLAVTWTFLISQVFAAIQVLLLLTGTEARLNTKTSIVINQVFDLVFCLVAATNFLLYYAFGQRFRKIMKDTVCQRHKNRNTGSQIKFTRTGRSVLSVRSSHST